MHTHKHAHTEKSIWQAGLAETGHPFQRGLASSWRVKAFSVMRGFVVIPDFIVSSISKHYCFFWCQPVSVLVCVRAFVSVREGVHMTALPSNSMASSSSSISSSVMEGAELCAESKESWDNMAASSFLWCCCCSFSPLLFPSILRLKAKQAFEVSSSRVKKV